MIRLLALLCLVGCIDKGPGPQGKKIDALFIADHLLKELPQDVSPRLDVELGGKVVYVGNTVDRTTVAPGGVVKLTHYWQVKAPLDKGWKVLTFVRGAPATADFMNLGDTDMQIGHGPATWKPGEIISDPQDITLRPDWKSNVAMIYVALVHVGGHDIGDRMQVTSQHPPELVVDRAIVARTLQVDLSRAPPPPGTVHVPHALGPINVDGVANDQGWSSPAISPEFAAAEGSSDPVGRANARMTWDEEGLYVLVNVVDSDVFSQYKNHDEPLWKQDCVEMFIDADSNRHGYVELQVNPNNATFDSWFETTRAKPGDEKWDSGMVTAVKVRGTADVSGDTDQGWDVEIKIPWAAVKGRDDAMAVRLPPQPGDRWRMNIVRVDTKTGGGGMTATSWNKITMGDFHALDRMLTIVFADATGAIVPGATAPTAPMPGTPTPGVPRPGAPTQVPMPTAPIQSPAQPTAPIPAQPKMPTAPIPAQTNTPTAPIQTPAQPKTPTAPIQTPPTQKPQNPPHAGSAVMQPTPATGATKTP